MTPSEVDTQEVVITTALIIVASIVSSHTGDLASASLAYQVGAVAGLFVVLTPFVYLLYYTRRIANPATAIEN